MSTLEMAIYMFIEDISEVMLRVVSVIVTDARLFALAGWKRCLAGCMRVKETHYGDPHHKVGGVRGRGCFTPKCLTDGERSDLIFILHSYLTKYYTQ